MVLGLSAAALALRRATMEDFDVSIQFIGVRLRWSDDASILSLVA